MSASDVIAALWEGMSPCFGSAVDLSSVISPAGFCCLTSQATALSTAILTSGEIRFGLGSAAWVIPQDVSAQYRDDEQHAGKFKLTLSFELPRGSYATIFTKRVLQAK